MKMQYFLIVHPLNPLFPFCIRALNRAEAVLWFGKVAKYQEVTKVVYDNSNHLQKKHTVW